MTKLKPIQLDDDTIIYIEVTDDVDVLEASESEPDDLQESKPVKRGLKDPAEIQKQILENFAPISSTIRAYTVYTLNAFKKVAIANVDKVTLEFASKLVAKLAFPT
jgi:protein associated with RNAse G/E